MGALIADPISNYAVPLGSSLFSSFAQGTQFAGLVWWAGLLVLLGAILVVWLSLLWQARLSPAGEDHGSSEDHPGVEDSSRASSIPADAQAVADDLTRIEGIGPKIQQVLNQAGIFTFNQLAESNTHDLETILRQAGLRIHNPSGWPIQARLAADGDWDQLATLQGRLKGGRQV
jgi:predicted flap endonuclease-1-like 5' DNA nuclease